MMQGVRVFVVLFFFSMLSSTLAQESEFNRLLELPSPSEVESLDALYKMVEADPALLQTKVKRTKGKGLVTPLIYAVEKGDLPLCRALIEWGADPNSVGGSGDKPALHWALHSETNEWDKISLLKLLISQGGDIRGVDKASRNIFHVLVETQPWEDPDALLSVSLELFSKGAELEGEDNRGFTPLMSAIMRHDAETTRRLLLLGADPKKKSEGLGLDAATLAEQQSHTIDHPKEAAEVLKVIREHL